MALASVSPRPSTASGSELNQLDQKSHRQKEERSPSSLGLERSKLERSLRSEVLSRRRRILALLASTTIITLVVGLISGVAFLLVGGSLLAGALALYLCQLIRLRNRDAEREMAFSLPPTWSEEAEAVWSFVRRVRIEESFPDSRNQENPPSGPPLFDRWPITQILWAGVAGWMFNVLAGFAEQLAKSSSLGRVRLALLRPVGKLLAFLSRQSLRTVAVSVVATTSAVAVAGTASAATPTGPAHSNVPYTVSASQSVSTVSTTQSASTSYTVQPGDTLSAIAERFDTTVQTLVAMNNIVDPDLIYAGQSFAVLGEGTNSYTVQLGDTLSAIAERFDTTVQTLVAMNNIADPDLIFSGQVLIVGGQGGEGTTSAPVEPDSHLAAAGSHRYDHHLSAGSHRYDHHLSAGSHRYDHHLSAGSHRYDHHLAAAGSHRYDHHLSAGSHRYDHHLAAGSPSHHLSAGSHRYDHHLAAGSHRYDHHLAAGSHRYDHHLAAGSTDHDHHLAAGSHRYDHHLAAAGSHEFAAGQHRGIAAACPVSD